MISIQSAKFLEEFNKKSKELFPVNRVLFVDLVDKIKKNELPFYNALTETDSYSFIDQTKKCVEVIQRICSRPLISVKHDDLIVRAESAASLDEESIQDTISDSRLWKLEKNKPIPKETHVKVAEENLAIYENRFIKLLIDRLEVVLKRLKVELFSNINTLSSYFKTSDVGISRYSIFNKEDVTGFINQSILSTNKDKYFKYYLESLKCLKKIRILKSSPLYKACSGFKDIDSTVRLTNILMKNYSYNFCFKFYIDHVLYVDNKEVRKNYFNYALIRFINLFFQIGFKFYEQNSIISFLIDENGRYHFDNIKLHRNGFIVTLECLNDYDINVNIELEFKYFTFKKEKNLYDKRSSLIHIVFVPNYDEFFKEQLYTGDSNYISTYFITSSLDGINSSNVLLLSTKDDKLDSNLKVFIDSLTCLLNGSSDIYSMKCPVCGSPDVDEKDHDFYCKHCGSIYTLLGNHEEEYVWIKRFYK